jgi:hypothetical protein
MRLVVRGGFVVAAGVMAAAAFTLVNCSTGGNDDKCRAGEGALTVKITHADINSALSASGACTSLGCIVDSGGAGCAIWEAKMTSADPKDRCVVTLTAPDHTTQTWTVQAGPDCVGAPVGAGIEF